MLQLLKDLWNKLKRPKLDLVAFPEIFEHFQELLQDHQRVMELIADLGEKSGGEYIFDRKYLIDTTETIQTLLLRMVKGPEPHHLQPLPGPVYHHRPHLHPPGGGTAGAADPVPGDAPGDPSRRCPRTTRNLSAARPMPWASRPEPAPAGAARLCHYYPGLPPLPGAKPPGGAHSRAGWRPGRGGARTRTIPPARSSTAFWRAWCPRKWPAKSAARRKRTGFWAVRSQRLRRRRRAHLCRPAREPAARSRPRACQGLTNKCWPVSILPRP